MSYDDPCTGRVEARLSWKGKAVPLIALYREIMSDYLFATPSFASGAARSLDLGGTFDFYNVSPSEEIANTRGLWADWLAIGRYFREAVEQLKTEIEPQESP